MKGNERGGIAGGTLTFVLAIFIFIALLFGACSICFNDDNNNSLGRIELIRHDRDGDGYQGRDGEGGYSYRHGRDRGGDGYDNGNGCQSGGCDNRSRRCDNSTGDCRSSFSPGPFKDSPVTIIFCPQQNSCNSDGRDHSGQGQNPQPGETPRAH